MRTIRNLSIISGVIVLLALGAPGVGAARDRQANAGPRATQPGERAARNDAGQEKPAAAEKGTTQGEKTPPAEEQQGQPINIRFEATFSYQVGTGTPLKRSISVAVADQRSGSVRSTTQLPVPAPTVYTVAGKGTEETPKPPLSFTYKPVGLNMDVRGIRVGGNEIRVHITLDFTSVDEKTALNVPAFPSFQQSLDLVLTNGKPLIVAQSSDWVGDVERRQSVEVKATIVK